MTGEPTPAERLAAALEGRSGGAADESDADLAAQAAADDARRARFDAVLATGRATWANERDPAVLRDALLTLLAEIRGPALDTVGVEGVSAANAAAAAAAAAAGTPAAAGTAAAAVGGESSNAPLAGEDAAASRVVGADEMDGVLDGVMEDTGGTGAGTGRPAAAATHNFRERAKYIPLRLTPKERKMLRLLEGALNVSQYTDVVDVLSYSRMRTKQRIYAQILDLCSVLSGLMVASDYAAGQELIADRSFADNDTFFQRAFEIGRRHKIANPEKMRSTYGKLVFLLQDSQTDDIARMLDFSCVEPLRTVGRFLDEHDAAALLDDPLVPAATAEIRPDGLSRPVIQRKIKEKERAVEALARRYASADLDPDDVRTCLYSIGDNNAYLRCARDPCEDLIVLLKKYFGPNVDRSDKSSSLGIRAGRGGAKLTHDHARQYQYCLQSLTLWSAIGQHMYQLWCLAESDLFDPNNPYTLRNTGQGLNRVQASPRVARVMHKILHSVQSRVGSWVGSSVIHLGDSNVPNSLAFIDKYAQLPRILLPLSTVIRRLPEIAERDKFVAKYVDDTYGGVDAACKLILRDFFTHAFDGSGGVNMFDSGACIDGRLTSTWNWSSLIEKKVYYPLFLLTGFVGFDGSDFS